MDVERWFLELREPMFRYLRTMGCPHAVAEEITQETFFRLHIEAADGPPIQDVRAWLFRVARNLWIDHQREIQRYSADGHDGGHSDSRLDPEQQLLQRERIRLFRDEVQRLPTLQRKCVNMKAQGLRYHEIAAALDIPMTTAVDCVRRAVKRIARRFAN